MTKQNKIQELENLLWQLEDDIYTAKKHGKDLLEYFPMVLKAKIVRAQIQALNWKLD